MRKLLIYIVLFGVIPYYGLRALPITPEVLVICQVQADLPCGKLGDQGAKYYLKYIYPDVHLYRTKDGMNMVQFTLAAIHPVVGGADKTKAFTLAEELIKAKVDINGISRHGTTALHDAILEGDPEKVQFLLSHNADKMKRVEADQATGLKHDFEGMTAVELARNQAHKDNTFNRQKVAQLLDWR